MVTALCIERILWMTSTTAGRGPYIPASAAVITFFISLLLALMNLPAWIRIVQRQFREHIIGCQPLAMTGIYDTVLLASCLLTLVIAGDMLWKFNKALPISRSVVIQSEIKVCTSVLAITLLNFLPIVFLLSSVWLWTSDTEWPLLCIPIQLARKGFAFASAFRPFIFYAKSRGFRKCMHKLVSCKSIEESNVGGIKSKNKVGVNSSTLENPKAIYHVSKSVVHCDAPCNRISVSSHTFTESSRPFNDSLKTSCQNGEKGSQMELRITAWSGREEDVSGTPVESGGSSWSKAADRKRAFSDSILVHVIHSEGHKTLQSKKLRSQFVPNGRKISHVESRVFHVPSLTVSLVEQLGQVDPVGDHDTNFNINLTMDGRCSNPDKTRRLTGISEGSWVCNKGKDLKEKQHRSQSLPVFQTPIDLNSTTNSEKSLSCGSGYESLCESSYKLVLAQCKSAMPTLPGAISTPQPDQPSAFMFDLRHVHFPSSQICADTPASPTFTKQLSPDNCGRQSSEPFTSCMCTNESSPKNLDKKDGQGEPHEGRTWEKPNKKLSIDVHEENSGVYIRSIGI